MNIIIHQAGTFKIAEIISDSIVINTTQDSIDLLGNLYFQNIDKVIIHKANLTADFFDLKNGIAGDILQKFSNYRVRLAIVGNFSEYKSKSLHDFIYECNKGRQVCFVGSSEEAVKKLAN